MEEYKRYYELIDGFAKDCPHCKGSGTTMEEERHPYGSTYVYELVVTDCEYCAEKATAAMNEE